MALRNECAGGLRDYADVNLVTALVCSLMACLASSLGSSLHLATGQCIFVAVLGQADSLGNNLVKGVVDQRIHDHHALLGNTRFWVDLLQHLEYVGYV